MQDKDRVFSILCSHCCSVMDGWVPYPSTCIAVSTGWRLSYVRRLLEQLKQEGLITSDLYVEADGELDRPILIRGYTLTPAGKNTQAYRLAWETEREVCKQYFQFDIGPVKEYIEEFDFNE